MAIIRYSIIIPHYNSENELSRLLKTIPNRKDIEVIVIDDKSETISFINVLNNSKLNNISYYLNNGAKGAGAARNIGLNNANGEFLIFADSDDYFTETAFGAIDYELANCKDDTDIIFFNVTSVDHDGNIGFRHIKTSYLVSRFLRKKGKYYEEKLKFNHQGPCAKLYRRGFLTRNAIIFDEIIVANDGMFTFRAAKESRSIQVSKEVIYCITQSSGTLTTTKNVNNYRLRLEVFVNCYNYLSESDRFKTGMSPLPILYMSKGYGINEFLRSINYLRINKVSLLRNLPISKDKIKNLYVQTLIKK